MNSRSLLLCLKLHHLHHLGYCKFPLPHFELALDCIHLCSWKSMKAFNIILKRPKMYRLHIHSHTKHFWCSMTLVDRNKSFDCPTDFVIAPIRGVYSLCKFWRTKSCLDITFRTTKGNKFCKSFTLHFIYKQTVRETLFIQGKNRKKSPSSFVSTNA